MAHGWLQATNGLGELIDHDFEKMSLVRLYQVSTSCGGKKKRLKRMFINRNATFLVSMRPSRSTI
jgi:hypothetical protein